MRLLIVALILFSLVSTGSCCGKGRKKKGQKGPPQPSPEEGDAIERLLGKDVTTSPYAAGSDTPGDCDQLKCNLDEQDSCCWSNAAPPADELEFAKGKGEGEPEKLQTNFGTSEQPSGNYFITASDNAGSSDQSAQLYSCPISCAEGEITVKLKHWQTKGTKLQVCTETDPAGPPDNCKDLSGDSGSADSATIPAGENVRVVIQAKGFTSETGDVALIDDIEVQCQPCQTTTTTAATPSSESTAVTGESTTSGAAGAAPCKQITCTFEQDTCQYKPSGSVEENWGQKMEIYKNRLTGVRKKSQDGEKFAACYTKKQGDKAVMETDAPFDKQYKIKYLAYVATQGVTLKVCCDDESKCPTQTNKDIQKADYKNWKESTAECPAGTKKVLFVCENMDGASEGACGVDKIELYDGDKSAC